MYGDVGLVKMVQLSVDLHPLLVADAQVVASRPCKAEHPPGLGQEIRERSVESDAPEDQGAVVFEQHRVAAPTGPEQQAVARDQAVKKPACVQPRLVDLCAPEA